MTNSNRIQEQSDAFLTVEISFAMLISNSYGAIDGARRRGVAQAEWGGGGAPARPSVCPAVPAQQPRACSADPFPKPTPETNSFHLEKRLRIQLDATLSPNSTEKTLLFPDD